MAAVVYSEHGNSSVLKYTTDHAKPLLRGNQILIRVHAAALNPCDFKFRRNYAPSFVRPPVRLLAWSMDMVTSCLHTVPFSAT